MPAGSQASSRGEAKDSALLSSRDAGLLEPPERPQGRLSDFTLTFHFPALEKEMATHSSVLAWRIPDGLRAWGQRLCSVLSSGFKARLQVRWEPCPRLFSVATLGSETASPWPRPSPGEVWRKSGNSCLLPPPKRELPFPRLFLSTLGDERGKRGEGAGILREGTEKQWAGFALE